jgi:hypothetical protein
MAKSLGVNMLLNFGSKLEDAENNDDNFINAHKTLTKAMEYRLKKTRTIRGKKIKSAEKDLPEPDYEPYEDRDRDDGDGPARINTPFTFGENMYGLCFIAQAKTLYRQSCEDQADDTDSYMKRVFIKVLGDDPAEKEDIDAPGDHELDLAD